MKKRNWTVEEKLNPLGQWYCAGNEWHEILERRWVYFLFVRIMNL